MLVVRSSVNFFLSRWFLGLSVGREDRGFAAKHAVLLPKHYCTSVLIFVVWLCGFWQRFVSVSSSFLCGGFFGV